MNNVIIACDFHNKEEALSFLSRFGSSRPYVKIGMELYYAAGADIVRELKERGHSVFLDLKLHDIPNTVMRTASVLASLGADMINVHAAGTAAMMKAAVEGVSQNSSRPRPLIVAVTQLTSTSEEAMQKELLIQHDMQFTVASYAQNAKSAGLDGVVCSPLEAQHIHEVCGADFITVTPGIRFADSKADDQKRIMTPAAAAKAGSDYIVVGRPITAAADPLAAYERCVEEFVRS